MAEFTKICPVCEGQGFWRLERKDINPLQNIANAHFVHPDGRRVHCMEAYRPEDRSDVYEFQCYECKGEGWTSADHSGNALRPKLGRLDGACVKILGMFGLIP